MSKPDKENLTTRSRNEVRFGIVFKSMAGIALMLVIFSVVICAISYNVFTEALMDQYIADAYWAANTASMMLVPDMIEQYKIPDEQSGTLNRYNVYSILKETCDSMGMEFIYVIQPDTTDFNSVTFIFSTANSSSKYGEFEPGYVRPTTNEQYRNAYIGLYDHTLVNAYVIMDDPANPTGPHVTVMVPLIDRDGATTAIMCVQAQLDVLDQIRSRYLQQEILVLSILAITIMVTQGLFLHYVLLKPVKKVTAEASRFARENVVRREKLTDSIFNRHDEINLLAHSIDHMEAQIGEYIRNITAITAERERIDTELRLAARIQADALISTFPAFPERNEFDLYASMTPAKEVGGDYYNFFLTDNDHLCLFIADVSGKGIPASLFMMSTKGIIDSCAMKSHSPAEILAKANRRICAKNQEGMFVTVWLGILEISSGKLTAASAGHEFPVVKNGKDSFKVLEDPHGPVLGFMDDVTFEEYTIDLEHGSRFFIYTDGVPEASDREKNMFGMDRLTEVLNREPEASPEKILANVKEAVEEFADGAEQFDDLTMLCIEYK